MTPLEKLIYLATWGLICGLMICVMIPFIIVEAFFAEDDKHTHYVKVGHPFL